MPRRQIFYSFHYANDVFRVQQVRNIGALEDNPPVSANEWETVKRGGEAAITRWIQSNMANRSCVVVLVGTETASRPWVQYEIKKAWSDRKGLFGIHIHNLRCPRNGVCVKGTNPFEQFNLNGTPLSTIVPCYDPGNSAYNQIQSNLENWVEHAIQLRNRY